VKVLRWRQHQGTVEFFEDGEAKRAHDAPVADIPERAAPAIPAPAERDAVGDEAVERVEVEDGVAGDGGTADGETGQEGLGDGSQPVVSAGGEEAREAPAPVVLEREVSAGDAGGSLRPGTVTFWQMHHEYGFVRPDEPGEPDVWVNVKVLEGFAESIPHLARGERVLYEAAPGEPRSRGVSSGRRERQRALRVRPVEERRRGVVEKYSFMLGHGSIAADDGTRCFLHRSDVLEGEYPSIEPGDEVFFTLDPRDTRSGLDPIAKIVKLGNPLPALHRFARFPRDTGQWVAQLAKKAAREDWAYRHEYATESGPFPILRRYLEATFERLREERRGGAPTVLEGATASGRPYAIFDTGLVENLGRPIYALFDEHRADGDPRRWRWRGFLTDDEGPMRDVAELPVPADYLGDPQLLTITPAEVVNMRVDTRHILVDHLDRFPEHLRSDPELARRVFEGALRELPERVRRNYRLAVAQYYRGSIHLLLPLHLGGASRGAELALVVERTDSGARRASTVLGPDHAYRQARVIARPEADWLGQAWLGSPGTPPTKPPTGEGRTREERRSVVADT
jgi:cold shock CspA family protein